MQQIPPLVSAKPYSISRIGEKGKSVTIVEGWLARYTPYPKGTVLPETTVQCCPRKRIADFAPGVIPPRYYEKNLEHNQQIALCCRHPELHSIAAFKSHPLEARPDIYIIYCDGLDEQGRRHHEGTRRHIRFFIGQRDREGERRPVWL